MKLQTNQFLKAIRSGKPQIGLWISLCSNFAADAISSAGFDWVVVDMEHAPNEVGIALGQLQAFSQHDTTALIRPMWNDTVVVKRLLDIGATGLVFPMVQSVEEAEQAVRACRYPPRGNRGVSVTTRANNFGRVSDYFDRIEDEIGVIVQIETRHALSIVEDIAAVEGVDGVFFGPADIGADMGILGKPADERIWAEIALASEKVMKMGKPVGTLVGSADHATKLFADGFTFVACGSDLGLMARGADKLLADVRNGLKSSSSS